MTISELKWQDFNHEIPEGTRIKVTDRNDQIYVAKNGEWGLEITWTKCDERMPPDKPGNPIIIKLQNGNIVKMSARWFLNVVVNRADVDVIEWAPFTPEAWVELNKNIS